MVSASRSARSSRPLCSRRIAIRISIELGSQPEAYVGGHLVVARTPGVQLLAGDTDVLGQGGLDVHMDVFQRHGPVELTRLDPRQNPLQAPDDAVALGIGEYSLACQHGGMRDRALDVVGREPLVELHRGGEGLDEGIGRLGKAAGPEFFVGHGTGTGFL